MTIREIEALSGMTRANIRFYESEGLLTPNRMENGYRDYTRSDLDTLHKIRLLRALGLGIDEIRKLSAGETALDEALESRLSAMQEEQRTLVRAEEVARAMLQAHADYATLDTGRYLAALEAGAQTALQQDVQPKLHVPWRRFFARMIDLLLYTEIWMIVLTEAGLSTSDISTRLLNSFLTLLTMLLLEPLLLCRTGTTFGKRLLGLSLRDPSGMRLRYMDALERTARLLWYGLGVNIPVFCYVRLYKSYKTDAAGETLNWEYESEQTAQPLSWNRGLAAALAAVLVAACGILGSLAAIGPRYRGDLTVAQFAEHYNRIGKQLGSRQNGEIDAEGNWTRGRGVSLRILMNVSGFAFETGADGIIQSVSIEADGGISDGIRPTGLMQLTLYAFAGAKHGHIFLDRALMAVSRQLARQPQEAFSTVVDGVAVDYQYRAEGNWYRLAMRKTGVDK